MRLLGWPALPWLARWQRALCRGPGARAKRYATGVRRVRPCCGGTCHVFGKKRPLARVFVGLIAILFAALLLTWFECWVHGSPDRAVAYAGGGLDAGHTAVPFMPWQTLPGAGSTAVVGCADCAVAQARGPARGNLYGRLPCGKRFLEVPVRRVHCGLISGLCSCRPKSAAGPDGHSRSWF